MQESLVEYIFHFMLVFTRIAAAFSIFPVIGSNYLFLRGRGAFALSVSAIILPLVSESLPKYSEDFSSNISYLFIEIMIGLIISIASMIYYQMANTIGQIIAMQSGLGSAVFFDPNQQSQLSIFSNFLLLFTAAVLVTSDAYYLFLSTLVDSYNIFPAGEIFKFSDSSQFVTKIVNDSFVLAFKISSPFIVVSLAILTGSGVLSRLMPNFQVFFVITPAQILVMISILYVISISLVNKILDAIQNSLSFGWV